MIKKITDILEIGERGADLVKYVLAERQLAELRVSMKIVGRLQAPAGNDSAEVSSHSRACLLLMFARNMDLVHHEVEAICRSRDPWG